MRNVIGETNAGYLVIDQRDIDQREAIVIAVTFADKRDRYVTWRADYAYGRPTFYAGEYHANISDAVTDFNDRYPRPKLDTLADHMPGEYKFD